MFLLLKPPFFMRQANHLRPGTNVQLFIDMRDVLTDGEDAQAHFAGDALCVQDGNHVL